MITEFVGKTSSLMQPKIEKMLVAYGKLGWLGKMLEECLPFQSQIQE